ncbi:Creatinase/aminopeptidase [Pleurotus eryngii]|uniref:Creatinase/aminopeptidase n=1 Tax=Pleurotus eryngii TaxID=5323 RepID=A0A9P5ZVK9_PLEER|nr:Creatinase/aminopeptidase [Pleurotus eryngii]
MLKVIRRAFKSVSVHAHLRYSYSTMGAAGAQTVHTTERLAKLRELMSKNDVSAFVVPSEDQHSSEYLAHCDERRAFISGFNGSAGCSVITTKEAFLFTDGRYFLQAEQQLDQNWTLMKQGLPDVPTWQDFLSKNLENPLRIGIDPTLISAVDAENLTKSLSPLGSSLVSLSHNIVDVVWGADRPLRPSTGVSYLDTKLSGEGHAQKLARLRAELRTKKAAGLVVTMLDEVAWLFNLRGADIDFNPVFFAYAVVTLDAAVLFTDGARLDAGARTALGDDVEIHAYDEFFAYVKVLELNEPFLLGDKASLAVAEAMGGKHNYRIERSPVADLKAIKNATELEGFRQCHIRDGAALARYFAWLEEELVGGREDLTESQAADQLEKYRSELALFKGLSFPTISSTGPNGAIIHYSPDPQDCAIVKKEQIYLCDSGAQFLDGTTDVTRTWHFGTPTAEEKRAFTRVLQGHIAIDTAVFPAGTTGYVIDSWARRALWQDGLDYRHGTGHGVGHFLNVHEGPHGIGVRIAYNSSPLKPGMTVSNGSSSLPSLRLTAVISFPLAEPGYYADGKFGIRIENIVLVRKADTPNNFGDKGYLGFEHVTMAPIHTKLVDAELLSKDERAWLNAYHAEVLEKVAPLLKNDERALRWLTKECQAI